MQLASVLLHCLPKRPSLLIAHIQLCLRGSYHQSPTNNSSIHHPSDTGQCLLPKLSVKVRRQCQNSNPSPSCQRTGCTEWPCLRGMYPNLHSTLPITDLQQSAEQHHIWKAIRASWSKGQDAYQYLPLVLQITAGTLTALLLGVQPPQRDIASALHASCQDALQQCAVSHKQQFVSSIR